ncbi:FAD:protein FMN transferase [Thiohalocapsa marina]|nr:FAD:protein FMN transferase [Thiohalocapsa marina]
MLALQGSTMGTTYSVQVTGPLPPPAGAEHDPEALQRRIDALLEQINAMMSTYRPDSELSRFNAAATTDWFAVSPELAQVVATAQSISRASDGAFDVTVGPLVNLWGFGPELDTDLPPSQARIDATLARTGYQLLEVRQAPPALRKAHADVYVDLSAIAKGYGVDRVAALLTELGYDNALVEIGGELRGQGVRGPARPWRIAVERPQADGPRRVFRVVQLRNLGMATSGDYRNFFELDGVNYSHTIDPATGRPVHHQLASVTVLAEQCMLADAWATALLVLGPERGLERAESLGLAALLIERQGEALSAQSTPAFDRLAPQ